MLPPEPRDSTDPDDPPPATDVVAHHAIADHAGARDELFRRIGPAVYAWASIHLRGSLRTRFDPEDLLQEVACRTLASLQSWDPTKGPFRAFVFGIAKNVLRKGLERLARDPTHGAPDSPANFGQEVQDPATSLTRALARDDAFQRARERIEALSDEDRRLLLHRGLEGLRHDRVAELLATTPDSVMKRWQRLRDRLREEPRLLDLLSE